MTDQLAAFACLLDAGDPGIAAVSTKWHRDRLVMDKWFMMQIAHAAPDGGRQAREDPHGTP